MKFIDIDRQFEERRFARIGERCGTTSRGAGRRLTHSEQFAEAIGTLIASVAVLAFAYGFIILMWAVFTPAQAQEVECSATDYAEWLKCMTEKTKLPANPCERYTGDEFYRCVSAGDRAQTVFTLPDGSTLTDGTAVPDGSRCKYMDYDLQIGKCITLYVEDQVMAPVGDVFLDFDEGKLWKDEYGACSASVDAWQIAYQDEKAKRQAVARKANQLQAELGYLCLEARLRGSDYCKRLSLAAIQWADEG